MSFLFVGLEYYLYLVSSKTQLMLHLPLYPTIAYVSIDDPDNLDHTDGENFPNKGQITFFVVPIEMLLIFDNFLLIVTDLTATFLLWFSLYFQSITFGSEEI